MFQGTDSSFLAMFQIPDLTLTFDLAEIMLHAKVKGQGPFDHKASHGVM